MAFSDSRWSATDDQLAVRIKTNDVELKGLLQNSVVIEPGTKACLFQEGSLVGEIGHGEWTLKAFTEKLQFWRKGQTTIILTRSEVIDFDYKFEDLITADSFPIEAELRVSFQLNDIASFLLNLMGPRDEFLLSQLSDKLQALVGRELQSVVGQKSMADVNAPDFATKFASHVTAPLNVSLKRYGLMFLDVVSAQISSQDFDELAKKTAKANVDSKEYSLESSLMQRRAAEMAERTDVRRQLRDVVDSDKMDSIKTKEEMKSFLLEINHGRVLRQEETDQLIEGFEERKEDRQEMRRHLLDLINLNREQELDTLRNDINHQSNLDALKAEQEIAQLAGENSNSQWKRELSREIGELEHSNQKKKIIQSEKWARIREKNKQQRDDKLDKILHEHRLEQAKTDVDISNADRRTRVALIEKEMEARLAAEQLNIEKRQKEWEMEVASKESMSQLERMQKIQEMNLQVEERKQKLSSDLQELAADNTSQRELEKLKTIGGLSTEALIASSNTANASVLADLKKTEAVSGSEIAGQNALNEERLKMFEKLNDAEKSKADAIAQAYKDAMQSQQSTVEKAIAGVTQSQTPAPPPIFSPQVPPPVAAPVDQWFVSINGQQSAPMQLMQIQQMIITGQVLASTHVWKTGMPQWMPAGQVPDLRGSFGSIGSDPTSSLPPGPPPA